MQEAATLIESPDLQIDVHLIIKQFGLDLYTSLVAQLWEAIRNGLTSNMPGMKWDHSKLAAIEIIVQEEATGRTCYLLDRGSGLTEAHRARMHRLGGNEHSERVGGASKRQIGRFAAMSLNTIFQDERQVSAKDGIVYFTRTQDDVVHKRPISELSITVASLARVKAFDYLAHSVKDTDPRLGPFVGVKGPFTLLVIPNFSLTVDEIRRELPAFLPRKADRQIRLTVNEVPLQGWLMDGRRTYTSQKGDFSISLKRADPNSPLPHEARGEIAICDADSSCMVATTQNSGTHQLPLFLSNSKVTGVIYFPNLFGRTNTGRSALSPHFWGSPEGRRFLNYCRSSPVRELVSALVGEEVSNEPAEADEALESALGTLAQGFGPAEYLHLTRKKRETEKGTKEPKKGETPDQAPDETPNPNPNPTPPGTDKPGDRHERPNKTLVLPIGGRKFLLQLEPNEQSRQVAYQPYGATEDTIQGQTYSIISVNTQWLGSAELNKTQRTSLLVFELLRVAAECQAPTPRQRDELRSGYWTDIARGAWKARRDASTPRAHKK